MKLLVKPNVLLLCIYIALLATVFNAFTIDGKNYLLIGYSVVAALLLALLNIKSFPELRDKYLLFLLFYLTVSALINFETTQLQSLAYSFYFVLSFIFYSSLMRSKLDVEQYRKILVVIFILYFIVLIIGQLYIYFGMFNSISGVVGFLNGRFGTILEADGFRYYSLSSEPSYAAFIIVTIFYSYIKTDSSPNSLLKANNLIFLAVLMYMILVIKSAYGIILIGLVLVDYFGFTKKSIIVYLSVPVILIALLLSGYNFLALNRLVNIVEHLELSNLRGLFVIDFNAYFRLAPFLYYFETSSLLDYQFYIGHGASASRQFIVPEIFTAYVGGEFRGGFFPAFLFDYGILGAGLVFAFMLKLVPKPVSVPSAILFLLLFNANFNTQLFWFTLLCLSLNKYYNKLNDEPVR